MIRLGFMAALVMLACAPMGFAISPPGSFTLANDAPYWDPSGIPGPAVNLRWTASSGDVLHKAPGAPAFVNVAADLIEKFLNATGLVPRAHEYKAIPRNSRGDGPESAVSGIVILLLV